MAGGLVAPKPPLKARDPRDTKQLNGAVSNPPRLMEIGGLGKQSRFHETNLPWKQSPQVTIALVEKATKVSAVKKSTDTND